MGAISAPWLALWAGFGLFSIVAGVVVGAATPTGSPIAGASAAMAAYFEHVMHLPMSFHAQAPIRAAAEGDDRGLATRCSALWLSFFREHCAGFVALFVLLPLTLFVNWRLGAILIALVVVFALAMNLRHPPHRRDAGRAPTISADLAERVSDVLGNLPVIQSFARVEEEARGLRAAERAAARGAVSGADLVGARVVATRASSTLSLLAIFLVGVWLDMHGATTIGQIVAFMGLATMLIGRLEQIVGFVNFLFGQAPQLQPFFDVLDAEPEVADRPGAVAVGRLDGDVRFEGVGFSYGGERAALDRPHLRRAGGAHDRAGRRDRLGQVDRARAAASRLRSQRLGASLSTGATSAT